jgi:septal ring factor EnvC (AmiA/AmiB activator)
VRRFAIACLTVAAIAVLRVSASAQEGTTEDARKRLETDRSKLESTQRRSNELQSELEKVAAERERINARLVEAGKMIDSSLAELEAREKVLRRTLEQRHDWISAWVAAAMRRTGENPPLSGSSKREHGAAMDSRAIALATTLPEQREEVLAMVGQFNELVHEEERIRIECDRLRTEKAQLNDAQERLRQQELAQVRKAAADISKSVSNLSELIAKLDKEVAKLTGLGPYDQEVAAAAAAAATETRDPSVVHAPDSERMAMLTPGRIKPAIPFPEAKGLLPLPAQGKRVLTFGEKTQYGSQSRGLVLETRYGGQVVSPSDGWIVYAGEFRSYGQLLIINAGGGYHIFLAGLSQIDVQLGQFVLIGQPVGVMSAAAKSPQGKAQDNAPILYIEFRKEERPIDPDLWFSERTYFDPVGPSGPAVPEPQKDRQ